MPRKLTDKQEAYNMNEHDEKIEVVTEVLGKYISGAYNSDELRKEAAKDLIEDLKHNGYVIAHIGVDCG